jgi:hypothetical protein
MVAPVEQRARSGEGSEIRMNNGAGTRNEHAFGLET